MIKDLEVRMKAVRKVCKLINLALLLSTAFPTKIAIATTLTAQSGNIQASYSADEVSGICRKNHALQITRSGQTVLNQSLENEVCRQTNPFVVQDLDGDREPEVVLSFFTGGAHCCTFSRVFSYQSGQYPYTEKPWGNVGVKLEDLDSDGLMEFKSADNRFAYKFTSFAGSGFPIQIWQYRQGGFIDATRRYPDQIYSSAYKHWQSYGQGRNSPDGGRGMLAAYLAEKYLLGEAEDGWQRVQSAYQGSDRQQFFSNLESFLIQTGYTQAQSAASPRLLLAQASKQNSSAILLQRQGSLDQNDAVLQSDGSLYDSYTFEGQAGQQVTITLESSEFDTYLILLDPNGNDVAQGDDISQNNTNSSIALTLPSRGKYTVIANSYDRNNLGRYVLTVRSGNQPPTAQSSQQNSSRNSSQSCESAVSKTVRKIEDGRDVDVVQVEKSDVSQSYIGYPENRSTSYSFAVEGSAATSVMASPQFLKSMSIEIIENCEAIGMVKFGMYRTDHIITFGLFGSGRVEEFRCVEFRAGRTRLNWGEVRCL